MGQLITPVRTWPGPSPDWQVFYGDDDDGGENSCISSSQYNYVKVAANSE